MMFAGLILFCLFFLVLMPQSKAFLLGSATNAGAWLSAWAPFSYLLLLILVAATIAGIHLIRTWPKAEEPVNPMAKYKNDASVDED